MRTLATIAVLILTAAMAGCQPSADGAGPEGVASQMASAPGTSAAGGPIAVSNSYLAAALRDLAGEGVPLLALAEPGTCPGHFDVRPSQVRKLRSCGLLVRFDFQGSLDSRLGDGEDRPRVVAVAVPGGMCEPKSYQAVCRQVALALVEAGRLSRGEAEARQVAIAERMDRLDHWAEQRIAAAGLAGAEVLASGHQADFCRFLGWNVVATFSAADTASPGQIDQAVKAADAADVRLVIANLPEGRQLADALADRLGARVAVFGNFPETAGPEAFDELVRRNVTSLTPAASIPAAKP